MKPLKLCLVIALFLSGCALRQPAKVTTDLGKFYFGYDIQRQNSAEIVQAFDDGKDTYLQLGAIVDRSKVTVRTPGSRTLLSTKAADRFLVVTGVYPEMAVRLPRPKLSKVKESQADIVVVRVSKLIGS